MSIEDRNLKPGTTLVARYRKKEYRADVVAGKEGKVVYRLTDGREFTSPSAAGSAVMGGTACNGWRFWTPEGAEGATKASTTPTAAKKAPAKAKGVRKAKGGAKAKRAAKPAPRGRKVAGASNGAAPSQAIGCGECGREFPDAREAAAHMRDEHGSSEAAGSGTP
jgi:hypothetical protein